MFNLLGRVMLVVGVMGGGACSTAPSASDYHKHLLHPVQSDNFTLVDKVVYDNPYRGALLRYIDRKYSDDRLEVLVYPVPEHAWREDASLLNQEMDDILHEVDQAVAAGHYRYRSSERRASYRANDKKTSASAEGLRSGFTLVAPNGKQFATYIYLFLKKDKFLQFRTLFDAQLSPGWNGDFVVNELLPQIEVPDPSAFMVNKRRRVEQQYERQVQHIIKQRDT